MSKQPLPPGRYIATITRIEIGRRSEPANGLQYFHRVEPAGVLWLKSKGKQPRRVRVKVGASYLAMGVALCNSNSFPQPDWSKK